MDTLSTRALTSQLAEDLAWLEQHARKQGDDGRGVGKVRLAAALVRNCIGPFLDDQPSVPLHVVVIGGAGAGKSTVANLLTGVTAAESNAQAGFTRHPIAYTCQMGALNWSAHLGFLGPLVRLNQPGPASLDQDVYQVRRVPHDPTSHDLLREWIVWDCPDMTTWAAEGYIPRLLEAAALADALVYVASDERYNDEVPTQFLKLLLQTGKPVICCLMKMREADAPALIAHFQKEVLGGLPEELARGVVGVLAIPSLTAEQLADPPRHAAKWRIPLLNQVAVLGGPPAAARRRTVLGACRYLTTEQHSLLDLVRADVLALEQWNALVTDGQSQFQERYQREYLSSEKFRGFDEALVRLMQLLELPGVGQLISGTLQVLRTPYRLLAGWVSKAVTRPDAPTRPEQLILEEALTGWLDLLRREASRRSGEHALWTHLSAGFQSGRLTEQARERFAVIYREFQATQALEVDRTARNIYEQLEKNPVKLNILRGSKFALDFAAIGGTLVTGGIGWHDLIIVPLAASITHQLCELLGKQVVDAEREAARQRQQVLFHQHLSRPLAEWLVQWPATGGSDFERLVRTLRQVPEAISQLDQRTQQLASRLVVS